jgi:hypothetical protein
MEKPMTQKMKTDDVECEKIRYRPDGGEVMTMGLKTSFVLELGTPEEIAACKNSLGQFHAPLCDKVLLRHGFTPEELGIENGK